MAVDTEEVRVASGTGDAGAEDFLLEVEDLAITVPSRMSAAPIGVSPRSSADRASAKARLIGSPPFPTSLDIALPTPASP